MWGMRDKSTAVYDGGERDQGHFYVGRMNMYEVGKHYTYLIARRNVCTKGKVGAIWQKRIKQIDHALTVS